MAVHEVDKVYEVDKVFWRRLTGGDYFNVEKALPPGPRGQLHIDLAPAGAVEEFLGIQPLVGEREEHRLPGARVIGDPATSAPLQFNKRPNGRWGFPQQNHHDGDSLRHPAWAPRFGWPRDPQNPPTTTADGEAALDAVGGIVVYLVRTTSGEHFAGMTTGTTLPAGWPEALAPLFSPQTKRTGCIHAGTSREGLTGLATEILAAFERKKNVLVYGPPGTGKTHAVAQIHRLLADGAGGADGALAGSGGGAGLQVLTLDPRDSTSPFTMSGAENPLPAPTRTDWVTFHQDYGYEDFMVGLRPTGQGFELEPVAGRLLDVAMDVSAGGSASAGAPGSGLVVVDEINRGNVPKILGDFLTYMDSDYRAGGRSPIEVRLPKVKGDPADQTRTEPLRRLDGTRSPLPVPWHFPEHVYLLATMNSVDRAVAPLDTALGRRFERIDAMPDLETLAVDLGVDLTDVHGVLRSPAGEPRGRGGALGYDDDEIDPDDEGTPDGGADTPGEDPRTVADWTPTLAAVTLLTYLNDEIAERLGTDFELGHVYFLDVRDWHRLARVWDLQIWPQLRDRFGARPEQLAEILRTDNPRAPVGYPFSRRRPGGRALTVAPLAEVGDATAATALRFLCTGRP